jgi:Tfp pilus assembly protein PilX
MRNEKGMILVVVMIMMILVTGLGIMIISSTTSNITVTGNRRLKNDNLYAGESGIDISGPFIEDTSFERSILQKYSSFSFSSDVTQEILAEVIDRDDTGDNALSSPDVTFTLSGKNINIDVDYLYATTAAGGAIEYASGYEGAGKGLGQAGAEIYYRVNILSSGAASSTSKLGALYKHVSK